MECMYGEENKFLQWSGTRFASNALGQSECSGLDGQHKRDSMFCFVFISCVCVCVFLFLCVCVCLKGTKNVKENKINQQNMADFGRSSYSSME